MRSQIGLLAGAGAVAVVMAKPEQIRADQDPVFHLYLQSSPSDPSLVVLGPESSSEYFNIDAGAIQSANSSLYLTIASAETTSYKTLTLNETAPAPASGWALEGDTVITANGSPYGRQLNFLVCELQTGGFWQVYFQTGSDTPAGRTCTNYMSLHLPCLC